MLCRKLFRQNVTEGFYESASSCDASICWSTPADHAPPVCFGVQVQEAHRLVDTILSMQPWLAASAGGEGSGDQFVHDLAETIQGRVPSKIDMELAHKRLFQVRSAAGLLKSCLYRAYQTAPKTLRSQYSG